MPLKLIGTIILLVILTFFAGFNLDNRCAINLLVKQFDNIPVFFVIFLSFIAGMIVALPLAIFGKRKPRCKNAAGDKNNKKKKQEIPETSGDAADNGDE